MKLVQVHVAKFRNILDSTETDIQPDVTCLVGKNESGKTAFLHALYRLRPFRPNVKFDVPRQYPAWLEKRHRMEGQDLSKVVPVRGTFELEKIEIDALESHFGKGILGSLKFVIERNYANELSYIFEPKEDVVVRNLIEKAGVAKSVPAVDTVAALDSAIAEMKARQGEESATARDAATKVEQVRGAILGKGTIRDAMIKIIEPLTPTFFYFDDYASLPGIVKIETLLKADPAKLDDEQLTALSLLKAGGTEKEYLLNANYETRKRELENVANAITEEVLKYWTTNPELRVLIDISQKTVATAEGGQQAVVHELHIRLDDARHLLSLPFDERSTGFRWFFSFISAFSKHLYSKEPVILLLDEPGLGLHARAQKDFLNFIDARLAKRCQVIYSTHSPFMVQPGKLERARVVEDRGREVGSIVSSDVLTIDSDTLFPLQGALGYDLAQHLFIGQNNLVIEGTSDFTYLTVLSDWLKEQGRKSLDPRWTLVPVGGVDMVPTFVALLGIHLDLTVIVDARKEGHQRLSSMAKKGYLKATRIVTIGEILNRPAADIEDLFDVDEYLNLYNLAFGKNLTAQTLSGTDPIVSRIARHEGIDRFDHGRPADIFMRQRDKLLSKLSVGTLDNFERLIERVNATLPLNS